MEGPKRIKVMLVDDHDVVRKGLSVFLRANPDLELVGEARNGAEAVQKCEQFQPDVVLMDLVMPEMDGAEATRIIRQRFPRIQVIALTSFQEKDLVHRALQAGAISYLLKNISANDLSNAIRDAYAGQATLSPEATQVLVRAAVEEPPPDYDLTPREEEVLELMVEGLSNADIADRLVVSRSTVKAHVSHILSKLDVSNRTEAITLAVRNKLVS